MKRHIVGAVVWLFTAWIWTYMLLGFFIPIGAYHTVEEERIHQAYVNGPDKPTIAEVDHAIQGSIRHTNRIKMLIAFPMAIVEYGLYMAVKSRRNKTNELSPMPAKRD